jgi:hypothetical protein
MISHFVKKKRLTLFALILLHHARLAQPSSSLSMFSLPSLSLISPASWGAGPSLAPFPQADPISLNSQATARSHVGHNNYVLSRYSCTLYVFM